MTKKQAKARAVDFTSTRMCKVGLTRKEVAEIAKEAIEQYEALQTN